MASSSLRFLFVSLEKPMDAVFIRKMSVTSKRHIPQIVKQLLVRFREEPIEDRSQLLVLPAVKIHADGIALFRCSRGMLMQRKAPGP